MISSCDDLEMIIREQLSEDITEGDFDVGFVDGSSIHFKASLVQRIARKSDGRKRV